ncbi:MAG: hypothetical protein A7315_06345 [Candidatus Altiarchaeales archaeon WOR_SM1_79]|nr:MAG: hypothetical protein A7315_06345 [Candidatus Altiarchaeales archaeon WOR_SM1_79]
MGERDAKYDPTYEIWEEYKMKRRWCVRDGIFENDDSLWWLNRDRKEVGEKKSTPMTIALKNGNISRVIDIKLGGLSANEIRRGEF